MHQSSLRSQKYTHSYTHTHVRMHMFYELSAGKDHLTKDYTLKVDDVKS